MSPTSKIKNKPKKNQALELILEKIQEIELMLKLSNKLSKTEQKKLVKKFNLLLEVV